MFWVIAALCGAFVGLTLGLVGGGGSILAMPLMMQVLGVGSTHVAIGTAAVAVTASALVNLGLVTRFHAIKWRCVGVFALSGIVGAALGAALGKRVAGTHLLFLFGVLMLVVGVLMFRPRASAGDAEVRLNRKSAAHLAPRLVGLGVATGAVSGFFGIGGGFLIVPALIFATGMPTITAVASSLFAIAAFGFTTATSYALAGLVDWPLAGIFIAGGVAGGAAGARIARHLATRRHLLARVFAVVVVAVGLYVCYGAWQSIV